MSKSVRRGIVISVLILSFIGGAFAQERKQELATVQQLKAEAVNAVLQGKFSQTNDLLKSAAASMRDPLVTQMAGWISQFEKQRTDFASERHVQYEKAVADVRKLLDAGLGTYAIDAAARAFLLADDKAKFRAEQWVDDLVKSTAAMGLTADANEQWLRSLRIYADLSSIEPANPEWKEKLKLATRRLRLIALYNPDELKKLQEVELKDREAADALLKPTTKPTTKPTSAESDDSFRIDWRETLRGVEMPMLKDALFDAQLNYYRPVDFRSLMIGGLKGLQTLASTRGLEQTFNGLADDAKRARFIADVAAQLKIVDGANAEIGRAHV